MAMKASNCYLKLLRPVFRPLSYSLVSSKMYNISSKTATPKMHWTIFLSHTATPVNSWSISSKIASSSGLVQTKIANNMVKIIGRCCLIGRDWKYWRRFQIWHREKIAVLHFSKKKIIYVRVSLSFTRHNSISNWKVHVHIEHIVFQLKRSFLECLFHFIHEFWLNTIFFLYIKQLFFAIKALK